MVGSGVRMGGDIPAVPGRTGSHVVAGESCPSFLIQVRFIPTFVSDEPLRPLEI